jgi:hypothetical protein
MRSQVVRSTCAGCLAVALLGCPDEPPPEPPGPCAPFLGDREAEPEIEITALGVDSISAPITDGDTVNIVTPPQGGRVIFIGVRATNLCATGAVITGALRDPPTMAPTVDKRTVNLRAGDDGWGSSVDTDISTFANVPVCPNQWSSRDIYDQDYELIVVVTDKDERTATRTIVVRPTCAEPDTRTECLCICKAGYVLGEPCQ